MNIRQEKKPSAEAQQQLEALRTAVGKALEKKRRLGQYAVFWENGRPVLVGEDAPQTQKGVRPL
ncbi:hypothetical protein LZ24_01595 [Desulfobotulus alkaliphilus]|uniref:Uncharacterized protein n=1 Tax=Desulfobotulus alkaliphilus TaxID=622671 RepID=A0A562RU39_9BACT|nr:hypothetical protein [Desulfobotulus alkaliphilus]TWI72453.1 hypothetical protein LZ24_01595 [Desulfobotulus alkaliphilus]